MVATGAAVCPGSYRSTKSEHKHTSDHAIQNIETYFAMFLPYRMSQPFETYWQLQLPPTVLLTLRNSAHCPRIVFMDFA